MPDSLVLPGPVRGDATPHPAEPRRWLVLPVVLVAMFMAQFDLYVVNVSLPLLRHDLRAGQAALELIVGGYAFMYASGLIIGGRLGDLYGRRRLFVAGTVAFAIASLLAGLSQNAGELVVCRLLQGLAASLMVPQVLAAITALFPSEERSRAMSWFGITIGVGAVAGQVLGGVLLDIDLAGLSWRPIFLVNVPIGLAAAWCAFHILPESEAVEKPKLDPVGTVLVSGGLALLLVALSLGPSEHWPAWTWVCLMASPLVVTAGLSWERRLLRSGGEPFLDLRLFEDRTFNWGILANVAVFGAFFSVLFAFTLVLQSGLGLSPLQAGLSFAPLGVAFAAASIGARPLVAHHGPKVIALGMLIACSGLFALFLVVHFAGDSATVEELIGLMAICGLGNGMAVPSLIGAVLAKIRVNQAGEAAGVLTTSQQFASAVGIAGLGSLFFAALGSGTGTGAYIGAFQWSVAASLILAALAATICATKLSRPTTRDDVNDSSPTLLTALKPGLVTDIK